MSGVLIAGAGLAGSLTAIACATRHPHLPVRLVDAADGPGDHQTWSFHDPDISDTWRARLNPYLKAAWPRQEVRFPDHARLLPVGYASLDGAGLADCVAASGAQVLWNSAVETIDAQGVTLADGTRWTADIVIDARGAKPSRHLVTGYQKFVGIEMEMDWPHGVAHPLIMDATVPQVDGYRFVYLLPFSPTRLLIEDTRYSNGADLSGDDLATAIRAYAADHGWSGQEIRSERGVLPIALAHDAKAFWAEAEGGAVPLGLRAGLFHPVTGYSLPDAVRFADLVADHAPADTATVFAATRKAALTKARDDRFLRLLNRMLFRGCAPERRYTILSRFYRLPQGLIERFYAGRLTPLDRLRIVTGKPPIPIRDALPCLPEKPLLKDQP